MSETRPAPPNGVDQASMASPGKGEGRRLRLVREALETLLLAVVAFALIRLAVQNYRIEGPSMEPNLHQGQFLLVNRLAYRLEQPERGDIVVFRHPGSRRRDLIKRVVGLPNEQLEIVRGQVWINGKRLDEPYIPEPGSYSHPPTAIGPDQVFVMGDNRNNSSDSRRWGSLPLSNIIGKAVFCYWPPQLWGPVQHQRPTAE